MTRLSRIAKVCACAVACVAQAGCGLAELGATQAISAAQRAKQAKGGVDAEKEAKAKVEQAMERAAAERGRALSEQAEQPAGALATAAPAGAEAAMKAAEEQSK